MQPPLKQTGALSGPRVVDLTQMLAALFVLKFWPITAPMSVIKVESPKGDGTRVTGPFRSDDTLRDFGGYCQSVNRNKRSIAVDYLETAHGRDAVRELIGSADIIVENFRADVMERLGLSFERLNETNPRLVYGAVRGFGDSRSGESPYAGWSLMTSSLEQWTA
jgi:crotonobetainyl-CoA:carnitine CoA-transferase CaiB-like acyl-CoA transferase